MDSALLKAVGQIAGIAGISVGVFLILFRELIRKTFFPTLSKRHGFQVILLFMVLTFLVALAGIGAWVYVSVNKVDAATPPLTTPVLTASLQRVDFMGASKFVAATEVRGDSADGLTEEHCRRVIEWIKDELKLGKTSPSPASWVSPAAGEDPGVDVKEPQSVNVHLKVPSDASQGQPSVERTPPGPITTEIWEVAKGSTSREHSGKLAVSERLGEAFALDQIYAKNCDMSIVVTVPGFGRKLIKRAPGEAIDVEFELGREVSAPTSLDDTRVAIGVRAEPAELQNRLNALMIKDRQLVAVDPESTILVTRHVEAMNSMAGAEPTPENDMRLRNQRPEYILTCAVRMEAVKKR